MTKQDIIRELTKRTNLTPSQATHAVEGLIEIVGDALVKDNPIMLRGFATIKTVTRAAKPARDMRHGKTIMLPPRRKVKFVAYNELQERINRHHKDVLD